MSEKTDGSRYVFVGGYTCLDFVNTQIIRSGSPVDLLGDFDDLVSWLVEAQAIEAAEAEEALRKWSGKRDGQQAFKQALEFRATLRDMAERMAKGKSVQQAIVNSINSLLSNRPGYLQIIRKRKGFERRVYAETNKPVHLIAPVAVSASELVCYGDLSRVKKCKNPDCVIYFYDTTKNQGRNWCSMQACGNRMKVAAHYKRNRPGR